MKKEKLFYEKKGVQIVKFLYYIKGFKEYFTPMRNINYFSDFFVENGFKKISPDAVEEYDETVFENEHLKKYATYVKNKEGVSIIPKNIYVKNSLKIIITDNTCSIRSISVGYDKEMIQILKKIVTRITNKEGVVLKLKYETEFPLKNSLAKKYDYMFEEDCKTKRVFVEKIVPKHEGIFVYKETIIKHDDKKREYAGVKVGVNFLGDKYKKCTSKDIVEAYYALINKVDEVTSDEGFYDLV